MAAEFRDALAEFVPTAFGNVFLIATGSVVGIRETRRIVGDYVLSLEDYLERASFADEICRNSYFIDLHFTKEEAGMADQPMSSSVSPNMGLASPTASLTAA